MVRFGTQMAPILVSLLFFVACVMNGAEADEKWTYEDSVAVLEPENFDAFIAAQEYTLVEFYAPWCGHCKSLAPEWSAAAAKLKKNQVLLAKVDCDKFSDLAQRFDVSGYPTIKEFRSGRDKDYDGPREAKGIVKYVKGELGITAASVPKLATVEDAQKLTKGEYALVGMFREPVKASKIFGVFSDVASELDSAGLSKVKAGYSASYKEDPVAASYGITPPAICLFTPSGKRIEMEIPRKRSDFTEELLVEWVKKNSDA
mmetsp:Transcript_59790/g.140764  ORF Transcript_59790/g.140764 Transcript_59790/m.140764 type:complete len:259 (-) Transcript_59790:51-827(-)